MCWEFKLYFDLQRGNLYSKRIAYKSFFILPYIKDCMNAPSPQEFPVLMQEGLVFLHGGR